MTLTSDPRKVAEQLLADSSRFAAAMRDCAEFAVFAALWTDPQHRKALRRYERRSLQVERQLRIRDRRAKRRDRRHPVVRPYVGWSIGYPGGIVEWPPPYGRAHRRATRP